MITAFLMLPVLAILMGLYSYALPQRGQLKLFDYSLFVIVILLLAGFVPWVKQLEWPGTGPQWPELVAAVGAYIISLTGLSAGLFWRRYHK